MVFAVIAALSAIVGVSGEGPPPDPSPPATTAEVPASELSAAEPAGPTPESPGRSSSDATPGASDRLDVHFIDVGQADATLLRHADATVLIDAGHWQRNDLVDYLQSVDATRIDLLVLTHPHADHIGQADRVLRDLDVTEIWWSGSVHTTATFARLVEAIEDSQVFLEEPRTGDTTTIGPLEIEVVNPPPEVDLDDFHDASLSLRITYGETSFVFTGDAEASTESRMVGRNAPELAAEVLKLGHHGSSTSTSAQFLSTVNPSVAIYSAGADNTYGHPHDEVVERVLAAGVALYGTDIHGTIVVSTDGRELTVSTESGAAARTSVE